jgi:transposase
MERSTVHLLHKRGKSLREIASELGRSKTTIARALCEPVDQPASARRRKSSVDAFREQIAEWLKQGLSGVRMMELAREDPDHPYGGCGSVWRAAVRRERLSLLHEQAVADVPIRFEGLPGEYLQVDWGEIRHFPFTQQKPVTRYFLACRLKYSRWTWVMFTHEMRQETLFRGLVACFNALGFVPWGGSLFRTGRVVATSARQTSPRGQPRLLRRPGTESSRDPRFHAASFAEPRQLAWQFLTLFQHRLAGCRPDIGPMRLQALQQTLVQARLSRQWRTVTLIGLANVVLALLAFTLRGPVDAPAERLSTPALPANISGLSERVAAGSHGEAYSLTLSDAELTAAAGYFAARSPEIPFTRIQISVIGNRVVVDAVTRGMAVPVPVEATVALAAVHGSPNARVEDVRVAGSGVPTFIHDQVLRQANASLDLSRYDLPVSVDELELRNGSITISGVLK